MLRRELTRAAGTSQFWIAGLAIYWLFSWNTFPHGASALIDAVNFVVLCVSILCILFYWRPYPVAWVIFAAVQAVCLLAWSQSSDLAMQPVLHSVYVEFALFGGAGLLLACMVREGRWLFVWTVSFGILSILMLIRQVLVAGVSDLFASYYMTAAYQILYLLMAGILWALLRGRLLAVLAMLVIGFAVLFYFGSRGAILTYLGGVILALVCLRNRHLRLTHVLMFIGFLACGVAVRAVVYSDEAMQDLAGWGEERDIHSRMLFLIKENKATSDSDRGSFYRAIWAGIQEHPFGMGVAGDREFLNSSGLGRGRSYAHNLYLEVLLHYGYVFGGGVLLLLHVLMWCAFTRSRGYWKVMAIFCFSVWFLPRQFSSTYLVSQTLAAVGIFLACRANGQVSPAGACCSVSSVK